MSTTLKVKTNHVNSIMLFDEINEFIEIGLRTVGYSWKNANHRESVGGAVIMWMDEFLFDGRITQYKVISDERANPPSQSSDEFNIHITYKQKHCLNTTSIKYKSVQNVKPTSEDLDDWITLP